MPVSSMPSSGTALLLIDFQRGFDDPGWGVRNNREAETNALRLLESFRATGAPVFHVRHLSTEEGSRLAGPGAELKEGFEPGPGESLIEKSVNSAFIGTDLEERLRAQGVTHVVVCGLTTPHCVSTTTRMAANLGFQATLVHDACAAFARNADTSFDGGPGLTPDESHRAALAHLSGEFARIVSTVEALPTTGASRSGSKVTTPDPSL